jgi:hypothetical protein
LQVPDAAALINTDSLIVDKGGAFPKELRSKEIEARRPCHVTPRNKTTDEPAALALVQLTKSAALEIERLDPTKFIARDDKGKSTTAIAELTKKLSDLKGGKTHLKRLTGFDFEQKKSLFRRRAQMVDSESEEEEVACPSDAAAAAEALVATAARVAEVSCRVDEAACEATPNDDNTARVTTARYSRRKRERVQNKSRKATAKIFATKSDNTSALPRHSASQAARKKKQGKHNPNSIFILLRPLAGWS